MGIVMVDLLPSETEEMEAEQRQESVPDDAMDDAEFLSAVQNACTDAEEWINNDVSPERLRAHRYYRGECDLPAQKNRSKFVMRVVRDTIEQTVPQIMRIFTGGTDIVAFRSGSTDKSKQSMAQDATEAVNHVFWNLNPGWLNMQNFVRDCLKAKTGIFKVYEKETTTVKEAEFDGPEDQFAVEVAKDGVEVTEYREDMIDGISVDPATGQPFAVQQTMVSATLKYFTTKTNLAIETVAPEEFLINRSATSCEPGCFTLIGQRSVRTVSDAVEMGVDYEDAKKYAGTVDSSDTGDYPDAERRARRSASNDPKVDQTVTDPATRSLVIYDLYMRVDKDGDGIAELCRVVGIGEGPAFIHEVSIVEDHPYCESPAIAVEHSVIGESQADNVMDLQDVETQITRQTLDNLVLVNNPRRLAVKNKYDRDALLDNKFNGVVEVDEIGAVSWDVTPFVGDKALAIREAFNETRAERTGINKESMGLAGAQPGSSEIGMLAVLGAGQTQPDMIAATIAHRALVPMARKIVAILRSGGVELDIMSDGVYRTVNPTEWPEDMDVEVSVGLGTGSRGEKIDALRMVANMQKEILTAVGPKNGIVTPEQYASTMHKIVALTRIGPSTEFFNAPEVVREEIDKLEAEKAQQPPPVPESIQKAQIDGQVKTQIAETQARVDVQTQGMEDQKDRDIAQLQANMKEQELRLEALIAAVKAEQGERLESSDVNLQ